MKNFTLLSLVMLVSLAVFATAVSADITVTSVTLGSDSTDAGESVSGTFTITNTGATTLTAISLSSTATSAYGVTYTGAPTTLAAGATSGPITITVTIPKNQDAVTAALANDAIGVGNIVASGNDGTSTISGSAPLSIKIQNKLEIKKVYITINGEDEHSLEDGDDLDDLKPGDSIDIRVEVENTFSNDDDVDIEDITVTAEISDSDFDVDEDDDISDIAADDTDSVTFNDLDVDDEASGTYKLEIRVDGRGESPYNGRYGQVAEIDLKVDRESHEIVVRTASLSPSNLACGKNTFDAKVKLVNTGKNNEDEVAVEVAVPSLGVSVIKDAIELDENDETSRTIPVTLPTTVKPGTYQVEITSYWNEDVESDQKVLSLIVGDCTTSAPTPTTPPAVVTPPTTAPTTTVTPTTTVSSVRAKSDSFLDSTAGLTTLGVGIAAVVIVIIILLAMMMRKN